MIHTIQITSGDVCWNISLCIYIIFLRLFACPMLETTNSNWNLRLISCASSWWSSYPGELPAELQQDIAQEEGAWTWKTRWRCWWYPTFMGAKAGTTYLISWWFCIRNGPKPSDHNQLFPHFLLPASTSRGAGWKNERIEQKSKQNRKKLIDKFGDYQRQKGMGTSRRR